jgi:hypothetical protein
MEKDTVINQNCIKVTRIPPVEINRAEIVQRDTIEIEDHAATIGNWFIRLARFDLINGFQCTIESFRFLFDSIMIQSRLVADAYLGISFTGRLGIVEITRFNRETPLGTWFMIPLVITKSKIHGIHVRFPDGQIEPVLDMFYIDIKEYRVKVTGYVELVAPQFS